MKNSGRMFFMFVVVINGVGNVYAVGPGKPTKAIDQEVRLLFEKTNNGPKKEKVEEKLKKIEQWLVQNNIESLITLGRLSRLEGRESIFENNQHVKSAGSGEPSESILNETTRYRRERDQPPLTFKDFKGKVPKQVKELAHQLKNPERYKKFKVSLPKAMLFSGQPGVGKTFLARIMADEVGRPFFMVPMSRIKEPWLHTSAKNVRIMFKEARNYKNCVIFIDEFDSVGSKNSDSYGNLKQDDTETINEFLRWLDGFEPLERVLLIAATNNVQNIDPALLRSGRFGTPIKISLPDENGRKGILDSNLEEVRSVLSKKVGLTYLSSLACKTNGFSGADVKELVKRAVRSAPFQGSQEVTKEHLADALAEMIEEKRRMGHPVFKKKTLNKQENRIGLAIGLCVMGDFGGDILEIEASVLSGREKSFFTGQLGKVMQESAQVASSYVQSHASKLGLEESSFEKKYLHLHVPEGATPKDGPSSGVAIASAFVSALTENPIKSKLAMTGEITLQGRVLGVGGLEEKLLAAKRHDVTTVILPRENFDDIQKIKKETDLGGIKLIFVNNMSEVLREALIKNLFKKDKVRVN